MASIRQDKAFCLQIDRTREPVGIPGRTDHHEQACRRNDAFAVIVTQGDSPQHVPAMQGADFGLEMQRDVGVSWLDRRGAVVAEPMARPLQSGGR